MTDQEILELNREGFFPGPTESEGEFLSRVVRTKEFFAANNGIPAVHWDWVKEYLGQVFDVKPLYICAIYSNKSLAPWQAAATWIDHSFTHRIQLRERLKSGSFLGYSREEILAHETVHAVRCGFANDAYEEFFAYMTSEKKWRRIFGPIVKRPWEVWALFLLLLSANVWPAMYALSTMFIGAAFWRLCRTHLRLNRAAKQIYRLVREERITRAVLLRLTDSEITRFAKGENVLKYSSKQTCLRWRLIHLAYLKECYGKKNHC